MSAGTTKTPLVGVLMGSNSDYPVMVAVSEILLKLGVPSEEFVMSAHRTPDRVLKYAQEAEGRGLKAIIAGAGGAAHLAGVIASHTLVPVIGVPIKSKALKGLDSLLSTVNMPPGIPVATMAIDGAKNAGLMAAAIIALTDFDVRERLKIFRVQQSANVPIKPSLPSKP
ncbi:5-(carboxyamino)imidazole ribonucleotide mutase [Candidatus Kaiserbacteria bacterium RIFCSPHIGHO2_12_FULL_56_13]|uniref:N5-carboxyaminoimidazole ribonucleotide mutase n=2 Tax=Candidatus Kaiseribacteriota TaxID=1752734 RepID=A0A1F6E2P8_9BACT|nr:MAG: 5-(carboxyamino)imidazole ribonucleotide mutase [Candidatus Kaiserbacteria bacterium RIFCSPHIGHO2_02_FULL_56_30]OGG72346.1 MAG: 5-(carboxyamino)imidazole ribonucleotide mutase [Candidatus Kaiserbacteria bacterium RIFCSPHIGHO2_12_FULL_56_13]